MKKAKLTKHFSTTINVTDAGELLIGTLKVRGTVTLFFNDDPEIKYTAIYYGITDILPLLENLPGSDEVMQHIYVIIYDYVLKTFDMSTLERKDDEPAEILDAVRSEGGPGPLDPATKPVTI